MVLELPATDDLQILEAFERADEGAVGARHLANELLPNRALLGLLSGFALAFHLGVTVRISLLLVASGLLCTSAGRLALARRGSLGLLGRSRAALQTFLDLGPDLALGTATKHMN